jgi:hypothetical protein
MTYTRSALLAAAGLVALSLPAHALGSSEVTDMPVLMSKPATLLLAARGYSSGAGSVGFKTSKKKKAKAKSK